MQAWPQTVLVLEQQCRFHFKILAECLRRTSVHRSCPLHFVFSPTLSAYLDQAFSPHSCKRGPHPTHETELRFLHIKGLHELGVYEKPPNYTGFAAKLTTLQLPAYCCPCFSLSLLNTSKYSKFAMSHSSMSLPLQAALPGSPAYPGSWLAQKLG